MSIFGRRRQRSEDESPAEPTLEEIEENPELLAAEAAVNTLPPPPASAMSILGVAGTGPQMVTFPGPGVADEVGPETETRSEPEPEPEPEPER
jgi:hypothetical protein